MVSAHGDPAWIELRTTDMEAAAEFYSKLFGWTWQDTATSDEFDYRIATLRGRPVAGLTATRDEGPAAAIWTVTFHVDDLESTAARLEPAGGMHEYSPGAMEIIGPLEHIRDATGATATIWQPPAAAPPRATAGPGAPIGYELMARRYTAACNFYRDLFGWTLTELQAPDGDHPISDGHRIDRAATTGTVPPVTISDARFLSEDSRSYWRFLIGVTDLDTCCETAVATGGMVVEGPRHTPRGRSAALADPFGATVQILEPRRWTSREGVGRAG